MLQFGRYIVAAAFAIVAVAVGWRGGVILLNAFDGDRDNLLINYLFAGIPLLAIAGGLLYAAARMATRR